MTKVVQTYLERWDELGQGNQEKIEIEEELELLVEHDGEEREGIVLLVANNIRRESTLQFVWWSKWNCSRLVFYWSSLSTTIAKTAALATLATMASPVLAEIVVIFCILFGSPEQSSPFLIVLLVGIPLPPLPLALRSHIISPRGSSGDDHVYRHVGVVRVAEWSVACS
jgi:hypothetical protein